MGDGKHGRPDFFFFFFFANQHHQMQNIRRINLIPLYFPTFLIIRVMICRSAMMVCRGHCSQTITIASIQDLFPT